MFKKDQIFWWASGIFVAALGLFAATQDQSWLTLMIASYLLRPSLASLGVGRKRIDERQMTIHYRSGNIAFAVMMIACVIAAIKLAAEDNHAYELFAMAIVIGLAAKALLNVILVKDFQKAPSLIITSVGLLIALFGFLEGSPPFQDKLMDALPGSAIAVVGLLSGKYFRPIGIVILAATALLLCVILGRGLGWAQIGTAAVVGVPLILAALCLFRQDKIDSDSEPQGTK
ncbi:MAG: hypothetical protein CVT49_12910 [candidate division Zixibacteria bacterium HGW-Zixibacteria-1]|nr:MAG: hypothetical protein CVT49_12910 [candidate division Zixibacteria bacterium HGW-Zixibacteria-1]